MRRLFLILLMGVLLITSVSNAQITNPNIPRSWWSNLQSFIEQTAELTFSFKTDAREYSSGLSPDTIAVFTPRYNMTVKAVDLWFNKIADPDSTLYLVFAQSYRDTAITIDSTGNGFTNYWQTSSPFSLTAASPCSVFIFLGKNSASTGKAIITIHGKNK